MHLLPQRIDSISSRLRFKDLYDPEVASVIQGQLKERVANNLSKFIAALEDGKYDSFALEDPQEDSNRAEKVEKVESDGQADLEDGEEVELSEEDRVRANVEKAGIYLPPTNPYLLLKNVIQSISFPELSAVRPHKTCPRIILTTTCRFSLMSLC